MQHVAAADSGVGAGARAGMADVDSGPWVNSLLLRK